MLELAREPGGCQGDARAAPRAPGRRVNFGALEVHLSNLRRKIGAERIRTVRGVGYLFEA